MSHDSASLETKEKDRVARSKKLYLKIKNLGYYQT